MISERRSEKAMLSGALVTLTLGMLPLKTQPPFCRKPKTSIRLKVPAELMLGSSQCGCQIGESRSLPMILDLTSHPVVLSPSAGAPDAVGQSSYCLQLAMINCRFVNKIDDD